MTDIVKLEKFSIFLPRIVIIVIIVVFSAVVFFATIQVSLCMTDCIVLCTFEFPRLLLCCCTKCGVITVPRQSQCFGIARVFTQFWQCEVIYTFSKSLTQILSFVKVARV